MIHCLCQSTDAHPDLARGIPPDGLLNPAEIARFRRLKTPKRQQDWLLGRWTAKHLLQRALLHQTGQYWPLAQLGIDNEPGGAAFVVGLPGWALSISHVPGQAFCATLAGGTRTALGADIERIAPRIDCFADDYFTPEECAHIQRVRSAAERDLLITAIWSAKEAVLKAVRVGLRVDTRAVACLGEVPGVGWSPVRVVVDAARLAAPPLVGWWRVHGGFVLSLAAPHTAPLLGIDEIPAEAVVRRGAGTIQPGETPDEKF